VNFSKLIDRVRLLLTSPRTEWPVIAAEPATVSGLYTGYIMLLAAIPAVCTFIKFTLFGFDPLGLGAYRMGVGAGISNAVLGYVLSLVSVFVVALIIDALAPTFGAHKDRLQALKTSAYAYTAAWVAGIGLLVPWFSVLILIAGAVYSIYLLYLGLPHTMKVPAEKAAGYTAVTVVIAFVLNLIVGAVTASMSRSAMFAGGGMPGGSAIGTTDSGGFDKDSPMGKLEDWSKKMEAAGKQMEAAQKSGDSKAQSEAMGQMMGAVFGGAGSAEALAPDRLKAFVPDSLGGLPRTELAAERNGAMGIQVATANGRYSDGAGRNLRLEITDSGGAAGLMGLASWAMMEQERETDSGYERTRKENGRMVHEEWNRSSGSGEYGVVLGERFLVKVAGEAASVDDLKSALASVNLAGLEALENEGVKPN
jgi:hypothetical protein